MKNIKLADKIIGEGHPPFIIAEMSGNHNGSLTRALELVRAAAHAGVDCLKFQTYTADTITLDVDRDEFKILDPTSLWNGRDLYSLYHEAHTPWEWHEELFKVAREHGMVAFSSPFDLSAVDFLESLNVKMYKVASFEITHLPLIKRIAQTGKPIIMSTGIASIQDIEIALKTARSAGAKDIILLKCTSAYPAQAKDANLNTIRDMQKRFKVQVGLSDHTLGIGVAIASVVHGATIIEKHFTLDRNDGGVDSAFSLEPSEMKSLKVETEKAWASRGSVSYNGAAKSRKFCQSIFPTKPIKTGQVFSEDNLKICRPGISLAPKYFDGLLGTVVKRDLEKGDILTIGDLQ